MLFSAIWRRETSHTETTRSLPEELAAAVSDGIDFSLVRDASCGYLDPAKFPNVWAGGALDIWKTQNNQQSVNMFTVKELYPVTDNDGKELLSDVFMVIVPEQNIEGYEHMTRTTGQGYDPNRDEANQTLFEDSNAMALVSKFNPMVFTEIHGRVAAMLIEPCTPPHETNFEYDLIAEQFAIDADEITMDSSFVDDLGADSVDLVELVMAMEEEFDIGEIEEEDLTGLKTVGDCVKYLTNKINN